MLNFAFHYVKCEIPVVTPFIGGENLTITSSLELRLAEKKSEKVRGILSQKFLNIDLRVYFI